MVDRARHNQKVYVDSDAFIAINNADDALHQRAVTLFHQLSGIKACFCTSNYVLSEVITVLSQRVSHQSAKDFISIMHAPEGMFDIKWVTPEIEISAIQIFNAQKSKNVSFVDCVNMAVVKQWHIDVIFSYDGIYKQNGFVIAKELFG